MNFVLMGTQRVAPCALRIQITIASALSVLALSAMLVSAFAQTTLPPVPISPPAQPQAQPAPKSKPQSQAPAAKRAAAVAKTPPTQAPRPQPVAVAPEPPPEPVQRVDDPGTRVPPGVILSGPLPVTATTAGPVQGYRALTATSSTKTATPIEQTPQSIQVIPRSVIEDQKALSPGETLRNVSGVQGMNPLLTPTQEATRIRGFPAEQWVDGLVVYYNAGDRDSLVNVERIEVLKGPSAILYGGGSGAPLGGAVNMISKMPHDRASQEVGVTVGSHKFYQPYFDVNQPLNEARTVLFRMTGQFTGSHSFIDVIDTQRYSLHPTFTFTNRTSTSLTVQTDFSNWKQQEYQGLPAVGTVAGGFNIRRNIFIGDPSIPDSWSRRQALTATLDHRFDPVWSMNLKARYSRSEFDEKVLTLFGADGFQGNKPLDPAFVDLINFFNGTNYSRTSTWGLANAHLHQRVTEQTATGNVKAEFEAGVTRNTLLLGADYSRVGDKGILDAEFQLAPGYADLTNPVFGAYTEPGIAGRFQDAQNTYTTKGGFAQLQSSWWGRLHLLGAVRVASIGIENIDTVALNFDTSETTRVLPRVGAVLDVLPGISVFGSYSEGMKANPFVNYKGTPAPEFSQQTEGGLKLQLPFGLTGTIAAFEINRQNVPVGDPSTPGLSIADGQQRSRGYEADLLWQPTRNWQVLASYAHIDAELTKTIVATNTPAGNKLAAVPEDSGRLWANYRFDGPLQGWSVGAGVYLASAQFVDLKNEFKTASYYTVDAKVAYDAKSFGASIAVKNLTGEEYFVPYSYFGGRVAPVSGPEVYGRVYWRN